MKHPIVQAATPAAAPLVLRIVVGLGAGLVMQSACVAGQCDQVVCGRKVWALSTAGIKSFACPDVGPGPWFGCCPVFWRHFGITIQQIAVFAFLHSQTVQEWVLDSLCGLNLVSVKHSESGSVLTLRDLWLHYSTSHLPLHSKQFSFLGVCSSHFMEHIAAEGSADSDYLSLLRYLVFFRPLST